MAFGSIRKGEAHREAVSRVTGQVRDRFELPEKAIITVNEVACTLPGCPPLETLVLFWDLAGKRYRFKIFKPTVEITEEDLPYRWQLPTLAAHEGSEDDCC